MKKAIIYSLCVCLFSWMVFGLVWLIVLRGQQSNGTGMLVTKTLYMFFPMIVALLLQLVRNEKPSGTGFIKFKISWSWLIAVAIPFVVLLLSVLISALMPGTQLHYGPEGLIAFSGLEGDAADQIIAQFSAMPPIDVIAGTLISGLIAGCTVNAVAAFGEEYGWRNYLVDALRGQIFWKAALLIGIVWGIWHAPLILLGHNYPQHPVPGVGMMCVFCVLLGVIELWIVLKTGSVIPAAMMHGTVNAIAGTSMFLVNGGSDLTVGMQGLSGIIAMAITIAVIYFYDRRHDGIMAKGILL